MVPPKSRSLVALNSRPRKLTSGEPMVTVANLFAPATFQSSTRPRSALASSLSLEAKAIVRLRGIRPKRLPVSASQNRVSPSPPAVASSRPSELNSTSSPWR